MLVEITPLVGNNFRGLYKVNVLFTLSQGCHPNLTLGIGSIIQVRCRADLSGLHITHYTAATESREPGVMTLSMISLLRGEPRSLPVRLPILSPSSCMYTFRAHLTFNVMQLFVASRTEPIMIIVLQIKNVK